MKAASGELRRVIEDAGARLRAIPELSAARKTAPSSWSIKEILGHLLDSAANNHQRFLRARGPGNLAFPGYEQEAWVRMQDYQSRPWAELIDFWVLFNRHLAHTIERIPADALNTTCLIGTGKPVTLGFLIDDYLQHLRHHLDQIRARAGE
jgi:hypothetical protein